MPPAYRHPLASDSFSSNTRSSRLADASFSSIYSDSGSTGAKTAPALLVVVLALIVVQVGFGGYGIVVQKYAKSAGADALVFSILRDALALPVLLIAALVFERKLLVARMRDLPLFFVLGLTGMFGNQFLYIQGLFYTTANIASVLQPCIPVFTALLAFMICIEPLPSAARKYQWFKILGVLLGTGGAVLMVLTRPGGAHHDAVVSLYNGPSCSSNSSAFINTTTYSSGSCEANFDKLPFAKVECDTQNANITITPCSDKKCGACPASAGAKIVIASGSCVNAFDDSGYLSAHLTCEDEKAKNELLGTFFLIGNCICMSVYILIQKKFIFAETDDGEKVSRWADYPINVTLYSYFFGAFIMASAAGIRYAVDRDTSKFHIPHESLSALAYAVLVSSSLCYGLIAWANRVVSPTVVTSFWPLQVFVTIILSYFVFGDQLAMLEYVGMGLIITGMFSVSYANHIEKKPDEVPEEAKGLLSNNNSSIIQDWN